MKTAIIVFPASNCDRDAALVIEKITGVQPLMIWHQETQLPNGLDLVILPGGFSYGDYLRSGAIAARAPIIQDIIRRAQKGLIVMGICNGFQILTETGLLPGVLMRNQDLKFICRAQKLRIINRTTRFTKAYGQQTEITIPVAHHDGNYFADSATLNQLEKNGQVLFKYVDNPNGSARDIAAICNTSGNIFGMMPHPERSIDELHGGTDGLKLFKSVFESIS